MYYYKLIPHAPQNALDVIRHGEEVIIHFDNGLIKKGYRTYKLGIDGKLFMEDLFAKVKKKATLHQRHFESVQDLLNLKEPIIINCMSMAARQIFGDEEFIPALGQLVYLKVQKGIDYALSQAIPGVIDLF